MFRVASTTLLLMDDLRTVCVCVCGTASLRQPLRLQRYCIQLKSSRLDTRLEEKGAKEALCRGNLIFKTTTKTLFRFKFHPRSTGKCRSVISAWGRRGAAWLNMSPFSPSELLEAPSDAAELEAVRKAKILYRSCMNESEFPGGFAPPVSRL